MDATLNRNTRPSSPFLYQTRLVPLNSHYSKEAHEDTKKSCLELEDLTSQLSKLNFEIDEWQSIADLAKSSDRNERYEGIRKFRLMLSVSGEIPIQAVIDMGIVPVFVSYLSSDDSDLQFESAWALTNIASGTKEQTETIVRNGAIPEFIKLLQSEREDIREQGMWGLGNFAGDRAEFRDCILNINGALANLLDAVQRSSKIATRKTGVWALSNLCRGHPRPDVISVLPCVGLLLDIIKDANTDADMLSDACWALNGISEHTLGMEQLATLNTVYSLAALLEHPLSNVQRPALRTMGQIAAGDVKEAQLIIDGGAVDALLRLLQSPARSIRKDCCWVISSILLGNEQQVQALLDSYTFPLLLNTFSMEEEPSVKKEAAWAICIIFVTGSALQVSHLIDYHCVKSLCDMLEINDTKILTVALDALHRIMKIGESQGMELGYPYNPYVQLVIDVEGLTKIVQLLQFPDFSVSSKVNNIVSTYLSYLPEICRSFQY